MKSNLKRHRLLKILADKRIKGIQPGNQPVIGVSWDELASKLNCSLDKILEISAPLIEEKEIDKYYAYGILGAYATPKGVSSYATEKYKRENTKQIFEALKNWVQTIVPLLSLLIAFYALVVSEARTKTKDIELNKYKIKLEELEKKVLDNQTRTTIDSVANSKLEK
jgi:hypothetical protein